MEVSKEDVTRILKQTKQAKSARNKRMPNEVRPGDTFMILHKEESELILDLLYDFLETSKDKQQRIIAFEAIKHIGGK